MTSGGVGIFLNLLGLAVSGFIIFASTKMRKLESYVLVMAAAIFSMVPCLSPCCCVGVPVGIELLGPEWSEPRLLALAHAFEQAAGVRRAPASTPPLR